MTNAKPVPTKDYAWESEHAPRIAPWYWWLTVTVFSLWVGFLVAMAYYRWVVTLQ